MILSEQLSRTKSRNNGRIPGFIRKYMENEIERLNCEGYILNALKEGDKIPDGNLLNSNNKVVRFSNLINQKPAIINFYRGSWCPYCNLELMFYNKIIKQSGMKDIQMFAISPESPDSSGSVNNPDNLNFTVLSDIKNKYAKQLKLVFKPSWLLQLLYRIDGINLKKSQKNSIPELPIPATYVIDENGIIVYAFIDSDYTKRADPSIVINEYLEVIKNME